MTHETKTTNKLNELLEEERTNYSLECEDSETHEPCTINGDLITIKCKNCNKIVAQYFEGDDKSTLALYNSSCKHFTTSWWDRECYDVLIDDEPKEFPQKIIDQVFAEEKLMYRREESKAVKKIIGDNAIILIIPRRRRITNK